MQRPIAAATLLAVAFLAPAGAQTACPDGRTFSGACVNPDLGEGMRKQVQAATQPKLSHTAPPVLPSEDGIYAVPTDYYELRTIYGAGAGSSMPTTCISTRANPC